MSHTLAFLLPGWWEWVILALLGLLIFGKRLPEVGKSLGKGIVEFKKGLSGIEDEISTAGSAAPGPNARNLGPPAEPAQLDGTTSAATGNEPPAQAQAPADTKTTADA